jgi:prepilin-type N-terminal cleavage/methylation domain-containing protein
MLIRRGVTLVELLVSLVLTAVVFGAAATSMLRQQQGNTRARTLTDADLQLAASVHVIGAQLSALEQGSDLVSGEARDSAVQVRAPIAASLVCGWSSGSVILGADTATVPLTGMASTPKVGDSLWWRGDSAWNGALVTSVNAVNGACPPPLLSLNLGFRLGLSRPDTILVAAPIRITRQTRYSLYRASDGTWQLGFREASGIPARFAASQPVAGPLIPRSGARRSGFRYFNDSGIELLQSVNGVPAASVARIRITAYALVAVRAAGQDSLRADSVDVALVHAHGP